VDPARANGAISHGFIRDYRALRMIPLKAATVIGFGGIRHKDRSVHHRKGVCG
jgi:hypothetical protein